VKRLYFVRHGESELNHQQIYSGHIDTPLTERGREQARLAGQETSLTFDLILSSPLVRALETAQIIATATGYPTAQILTNPLFIERGLGQLEGQPNDETDDDSADFAGMEPIETLLLRARASLVLLRELKADKVLLVSHGAFGRALQAALSPDSQYADFSELDNAVILQFI